MARPEPTEVQPRVAGFRLAEMGEVNRGKSKHRPRDAAHLYGGPYPFIQTGDIKKSGGRITTFEQTYSEAGLAQSRLWPAGTMCITIAANIAETSILTFPACFPDSVVGFVADPNVCDVRYVEYLFRTMRAEIQRAATGSVQDNINLATLAELRFDLPTLEEQQRIAHILGTFDDKIELNRRMSQTLEDMARALFKSWFVDFDPVRAKAEGRDPGLPKHLADLFPDRLVDSELGEIPSGWATGPLSDIATLSIGGDWGSDEPFEGAIAARCLRGVDLHQMRSQGWADPPVRWIKPQSLEKRWLSGSDVIVEGSGQCGRSLLALRCEGVFDQPVVYSNFCKRLQCESSASALFVEYSLNGLVATGAISDYITGTAMPNLDVKGLLASHLIVVPSNSILSEFEKLCAPTASQLQICGRRELSEARDVLLTRLLADGAVLK